MMAITLVGGGLNGFIRKGAEGLTWGMFICIPMGLLGYFIGGVIDSETSKQTSGTPGNARR